MKKNILLAFVCCLFNLPTLLATHHHIAISGFTYSPATTNAYIGDTITIAATGSHPLVQVSAATWAANGTTPLAGGWGSVTSDYTFIVNQGTSVYFVCSNHVGSQGMKGQIMVNSSIESLSIFPSNPNSNDSLMVIVSSIFSAAGCNLDSSAVTLAGNNIIVEGFYCIGMLAVMCPRTDTFMLAPRPAGVYQFEFAQEIGNNPCTGGQYSHDNSAFGSVNVSQATGVTELYRNAAISLYPNPIQNHNFNIDMKNVELNDARILIYNAQGSLVSEQKILSQQSSLSLNVPNGMYFYSVQNAKQMIQQGKLLVQE